MMSYILLNNEIIKTSKAGVSITDRGLQYGDGIFETMITNNGNIRFLQDHLDRISKGAKELLFEVPENILTTDYINEQVLQLKKKNNLPEECRIKLMLWRGEGGLYTPTSKECEFALIVDEYIPTPPRCGLETDFAETVCVAASPVSFCKTLSSLTYTLAGIEKTKKSLDDVILLSQEGFIAETISGNIFWVKDNIIFTPKVSVGCVSGISRKNIIADLENKGYKVKRVLARKADLADADAVLSTNVTGVSTIKSIGETVYKSKNGWRQVFESVYHY
ncbi:aminotransferase class IV [Flammeovirga agarivorans]|uniref:branched-chain-amino-acid transaminase n=1 Tax=Flammeovirga agarivorans TaxID=2726742 RepID=A0A7X8SHX1_9BACT|nr:aminotransferase class IV [Flammeovirga agarivorans]NLR90413.1 hypothetical protein [Flammeovirga agarivorans]